LIITLERGKFQLRHSGWHTSSCVRLMAENGKSSHCLCVSDSWSKGHGFDSRQAHRQATTLGASC